MNCKRYYNSELLLLIEVHNLTLDQLVRDDFDLPISQVDEQNIHKEKVITILDFDVEKYVGKVCDVSMNSFRYSVIHNIKIVDA